MDRKNDSGNKAIAIYLLKFAVCFCLLYYGTIAVIGITAPGGKYYSSFIHQFLNYPAWLMNSLLYGTKGFVSLFGYEARVVFPNLLKCNNGAGVSIGYDCLGYGVSSFWLAFVFANKGSIKRKLIWMLTGVIAIWCINILRISILLIAIYNSWTIPLFDQHTWFNIAAYLMIFLMIYLYDRSSRLYPKKSEI